jgi:hypothetical protein
MSSIPSRLGAVPAGATKNWTLFLCNSPTFSLFSTVQSRQAQIRESLHQSSPVRVLNILAERCDLRVLSVHRSTRISLKSLQSLPANSARRRSNSSNLPRQSSRSRRSSAQSDGPADEVSGSYWTLHCSQRTCSVSPQRSAHRQQLGIGAPMTTVVSSGPTDRFG